MYDIVHQLSVTIGPRGAGTGAEAEAASFIAREAENRGAAVSVREFRFRSWTSAAADAHIELSWEIALTGAPFPYVLPGGPTALTGTLRYAGPWAAIPQRTVGERWEVLGGDGRSIAAVLVDPLGGRRSIPNINPLNSGPALVLSAEDGAALRAWNADHPAASVTVRLPGSSESLSTSCNVLATVGTGERDVIMLAHFDSVREASGANDNAAGVAVALTTVSWFATQDAPGYRLVVVFTGAEEVGLMGSRVCAGEIVPTRGVAAFAGCLNLDMVAVGDEFIVRADANSPWVSDAVRTSRNLPTPIVVKPLVPSSDHWSFHEAGVPSIQLTRGPDPGWHHPSDTADRITPESLDEASEVAQHLLLSLIDHDARNRAESAIAS